MIIFKKATEHLSGLEMFNFEVLFLDLVIIYARTECQAAHYVLVTDYHKYTKLIEELDNIAASYPTITHRYSVGKTVEGRDMAVIQLSGNLTKQPQVGNLLRGRELLKPMVKYIGNMHGNEAVGRELMIALPRYLAQNYGHDDRVTKLLDAIDLHIMPSMNPDGFEKSNIFPACTGHSIESGRQNGNQVDLNRAFPSRTKFSQSQASLVVGTEPEVAAVINWIMDNPFVLSINFHDGAAVANYPWDENVDGSSVTQDDATFIALVTLYANKHATMHKDSGQCRFNKFPGGITNGAMWYSVVGSMQDFNYIFSNCMEITIETSCCKHPQKAKLQGHWDDSKDALLTYMEAAMGGVRGLVTDEGGVAVGDAEIEVYGIDKNVITSNKGEFWRILAPGQYRLKAVSGNMESETVVVNVGDIHNKTPIRKDLLLVRKKPSTESTVGDIHNKTPITKKTPAGRYVTTKMMRSGSSPSQIYHLFFILAATGVTLWSL